MYKPTGFLAKQYSVTNETTQRWIKESKFERTKKTKGGHHRIWIDEPTTTIPYARASSSKQKSSPDKQKEPPKNKYPNGKLPTDIANGFNQNRRRHKTLLELPIDGNPLHPVPHQIESPKQDSHPSNGPLNGGKIQLLEEPNNTEQFDTKTLIALLTSSTNSHYGKRSAKRNHKQENKNLSQ